MRYIGGIIFIFLGYCGMSVRAWSIGFVMFGIGGLLFPGTEILGAVFLVIALALSLENSKNEKNGTNDKKRAEEKKQIQKEYLEAVASQQPGEPWKVRYATDPCPYCGHYKVRNAKWEDKRASVAFWGVASSALGKDFKCEHCYQMW